MAKDTRMQFIVNKNTYDNLKIIAALKKTSMNAIVNDAIDRLAKFYELEIKQYKEFIEKVNVDRTI